MLTGHCLCGSVTYRADADPIFTALCHCDDCQRSSGSTFSTNVVVPRAALQVEGDTLGTFNTTGTDTGQPRERQFCTRCGSQLFTMLSEMPDVAIIKAGTLDDRSVVAPTMELWKTSGQAWVDAANGDRQVMERGLPAG